MKSWQPEFGQGSSFKHDDHGFRYFLYFSLLVRGLG